MSVYANATGFTKRCVFYFPALVHGSVRENNSGTFVDARRVRGSRAELCDIVRAFGVCVFGRGRVWLRCCGVELWEGVRVGGGGRGVWGVPRKAGEYPRKAGEREGKCTWKNIFEKKNWIFQFSLFLTF